MKVSSSKQYYWKASCGRHSRLVQPGSVAKALRQHGALRCFICDPVSTQVSRHTQPVQQAVEASGLAWLKEHHCVRGHHSPADYYVEELQLAVQADGVQHTHVAFHDRTPAEQQATDARFNNAVISEGRRALRIHYRDTQNAAAALAVAIELCQQHPGTPFVMFSPAYNRPIQWVVQEVG